MDGKSHYTNEYRKTEPVNRVVYIVNASRRRLYRDFASPYLAHLFVNKLRHSDKCTLVSWPPGT